MSSPDFVRSESLEALNGLLNHPLIRPNMAGDDVLDGRPLLDGGLFYLSDLGGMLFHPSDPGIYEGHYLFTARGAPVYEMALGMVHACVLEAAHRMLWGRVPVANRAARIFTRRLGFTSLGIRQRPFPAEIFVWKRALCHSSGRSLAA